MIIFIKGKAGTGKTTLANRLAAELGLPAPHWPLAPETEQLFRTTVQAWMDVKPDYFTAEGHVNLDRVNALCLFLNRGELPRPTEGAGPAAFHRWRMEMSRETTGGRLLPKLFDLVCRMVESTPHAIVEGIMLGTGQRDTMFSKMIRFRYSSASSLKILLDREPYLGGEVPEGTEARWFGSIDGRTCTHDEIVDVVKRAVPGSGAEARTAARA